MQIDTENQTTATGGHPRGGSRRRWTTPPVVLVGLGALVGSVLLYRRLWGDPSGRVLGTAHHTNDPMQSIWDLHWLPWALLHGHNPFHTNALYYPHAVSLSWNTLTPTLGLLAAPLTLTLGGALTYAVLMTAAPVVTAMTGYAWLHRHVPRAGGAVIGALFIAFGPFVTGQLQGHLDLTFVGLLPVVLYLLEDLLWRRRQHRRRTAVWLGVVVAAQAGINEELLIIVGVIGVVAAAVATAVVPPARRVLIGAVRPLALAVAVFLLVASPLLIDQLFRSPAVALSSGRWRALGGDYLLPISGQMVSFGGRHLSYLGGGEDGVYLGPAVIAVLVIGVLATWRDRWVRVATATLAVAVVLTFGAARPLGIPLPWTVLGRLPGLMSVLPSRFSFASSLIVGWLLARWCAALIDSAGGGAGTGGPGAASVPARTVRILAGLAVVAALVTLVPRPIGTSALPRVARPFTASDSPLTGAVFVLPMATPYNASAMFLQQAGNFRFVMPGGYALRPDGPGAAQGPPPSALVTLAEQAEPGRLPRRPGQSPRPRPGTRPRVEVTDAGGFDVNLILAGRRQLADQHYRAIAVVDAMAGASEFESLAAALTGRPADQHSDGVSIWRLAGRAGQTTAGRSTPERSSLPSSAPGIRGCATTCSSRNRTSTPPTSSRIEPTR